MRAEPPAALAERAARLGHGVARDHHRPVLDRDVGEPHHLPRLAAFVLDRLVDDHHDVAGLAVLVVREFGDRHALHGKHRVGAVEGGHRQPRDFRIAKIVRRRLLRPVDQLVAVDDLQEAALVGAVAEIDAVALRAERDRPVQFGRHRAGRARLLAGQAEIPDLDGMRGIGEVVDLRHAAGAPVRRAGDQEGDAGVAFPPALVGVLQAADPRDQHGIGGIGDVPDLMRLAAEGAQHVDRVAVALGQRLAVADPHHLRAAALVFSGLPGNVVQIFRVRGIGDVDDRGAVRLGLAGQGIDRIGNGVGAAVMADIGDPAVALVMDGRLIGAARLQVVIPDQPHVGGFRRRADRLALRIGGAAACDESDTEN